MNARIREITGQVLDELVPETWVALGYDKIKEIQNRTVELIVRECAGVCHTHGWGMLEHGMSGHNIADDCGTLIKEHFGVEE